MIRWILLLLLLMPFDAGYSYDLGSNANTSSITLDKTTNLNFTSDVTLTIDKSGGVNSITTNSSSTGKINFSGDNDFSVFGNVGNINKITTSTNNSGNLSFSGTASQTVNSAIGDIGNRLKSVNANNSLKTIFSQALYAQSFSVNGLVEANSVIDITGNISGFNKISGTTGSINLNGSNAQTVTAQIGDSVNKFSSLNINNSGAADSVLQGSLYLTNLNVSNGSVTINSQNSTNDITNLNISSSKTANFAGNNNKILTVTNNGNLLLTDSAEVNGSVLGSGIIKGATNNAGNLVFSGSGTQNISNNLGDINNRLGSVTVSNVSSSGVKFNNDIYATSLVLSNNSKASLTSNINTINGITSGTSSELIFNGSSQQVITGVIGKSDNVLNKITVNNALGVNLKDNVFVKDLSNSNNASIIIDSGKSLNIIGSVSGSSSIIKGSGGGDINFSGNSAQNIESKLGSSVTLERINQIRVNNSGGIITLKNDAFTKNVNLATNSRLAIDSEKTIDISGDVTGSGLIQGSSAVGVGTVKLSGSTNQNITAAIGSTTNKVNNLEINNGSSVIATFNNAVNANNLIVNGKMISNNTVEGQNFNIGSSISSTSSTSEISFTGSEAQIVNASVGSSSSSRFGTIKTTNSSGITFANNVYLNDFVADGRTVFLGNNVDIRNGITTSVNNGLVIFSGSSSQIVNSSIGNSTNKLDSITVSNINSNEVNFNSNVQVNNFNVLGNANINADNSSLGIVNISGNKELNIKGNLVNLGDVVNSGSLIIADNKSVNISGDLMGGGLFRSKNDLGNINFSGNGIKSVNSSVGTEDNKINIILVSNPNETIFYKNINANNLNITGNGVITIDNSYGDANVINITNGITANNPNTGELRFLGNNSQTVASAIGNVSSKLNNIRVNNNQAEITFSGNINSNNLILGDSSRINLSGSTFNITNGVTNFADNNGRLIFSGSGAQDISFNIGSSQSKLESIIISNTSSNGTRFLSGSINSDNFIIDNNATADIAVAGINLNIGSGGIVAGSNGGGKLIFSNSENQSLSVNVGSQLLKLGTIEVKKSSSSLNLNSDVWTNNLVLTSGNINIASDKTINIYNSVNGAGSLLGSSSSGGGNLNLAGASAQTISSAIGSSTNRLANLAVNNSNGVNFNNDVYTNNLTLTNGTASVASAKTVNVSGNISGSGSLIGATSGSNIGILVLSGTDSQTINSNLGSVDNKLASIQVNNSNASGAIFSGTVYADSFEVGTNAVANVATNNFNLNSAGITAATNDSAKVIFSGSDNRNINYSIGASDKKLKEIVVNNTNSVGGTVFGNASGTNINIYTKLLSVNGKTNIKRDGDDNFNIANIVLDSDKELIIDNSSNNGSINITNINGSGILTLSGSSAYDISTINVGNTTRLNHLNITNSSAVTLGDVSVINLDAANNNSLIASNKTVNVSGTINGLLKGQGNLTLSGSSLQSVGAIGGGGTNEKLTDITVTNVVGAQFNGNIYATNLNLNANGKAIIRGDTINVDNIKTNTNNSGQVEFGGSLVQTISSAIGSSTNRLANVRINKDSNETNTEFTKDIFTSNFEIFLGNVILNNSNSSTSIGNIAISDGQQLEIKNVGGSIVDIKGNGSLKFSGTSSAQNVSYVIGGSNSNDRLNNIWLDNSASTNPGVTFAANVFARNLIANSGTNLINDTVTIDISENISGSSTLKGQGNLTLSGSSLQSVGAIGGGGTNEKLTDITVTNVVGAQFNGNIYATNLNLNANGKAIIRGDTINVDNIKTNTNNSGQVEFGGSLVQTISSAIGSSTNRLANLAVNNSNGVNFNNDVYTNNLTLTNGTASVASAKTVNVSGNISGSGSLIGATSGSNIGILVLSGTDSQTINSNLGSVDNKLASIQVNNSNASGAIFSGTVYADSFEVGTNAVANVATNNFNLNSAGITAATNDSAKVIFSGSDNRNINYSIGASDKKLKEIVVNNTNSVGGTVFGNASGTNINIYTKLLSVNGKTNIKRDGDDNFNIANIVLDSDKELIIDNSSNNGSINITNINGSGILTLSGSSAYDISTINVGNTTRLNHLNITNSSAVTLGDVSVINLDAANNNSLIASNKTVNVSGTINGLLKGQGNLTLSGSSLQSVGAIGGGGTNEKLTDITVTNVVGAQFNGNIYATNLNLNANGKAIIRGDTINVDNIKTNTNNSGQVEFGGSLVQTISSAIGSSTNRLANLAVNNSNGVNFNNDVYTNNLTLTNGTASVASAKTVNVSGNISGSGSLIGATSGVGSVNFFGTNLQNIAANLGSGLNKLYSVNLDSGSVVVFDNLASLNSKNLVIKGKAVFNNNSGSNNFENLNNNSQIALNPNSVINVTNSVNLASNSKIDVGFNTNNGLIGLFNAASAGVAIADNSNINFVYSYTSSSSSSDSAGFNPGQNYAFLDYNSLTLDRTKLIVTDNSALIKSSIIFDDVNKRFLLHSELDPSVVSTIGSSSSNEVKVLNNIFSSKIASDRKLNLIRSELIKLDLPNLANAVRTLFLPRNNMEAASSIGIANKINNLINSRMSSLSASRSGFATGNNLPSERGVWGQLYSGYSNQKQSNDFDGYKSNINGLMFGFDSLISGGGVGSNKSVLGLALGYGNANVKSADAAKSTSNIQSYQLAIYNSNYKENSIGFYNENILNLAYNHYSNTRTINIASPKNVDADFDSNQYGFRTGFGYNFYISEKFLAAPNLALNYSRINGYQYQENGAGAAGLSVKTKSFDNLATDLGIRILGKTVVDNGLVYYPELNFSWIRNLRRQGQESQVSFVGGGDGISINSPMMPQNLFNVGGELNFVNGRDSYVTLKYDFQTGSGYNSHTGYVKYRLSF